MNTMIAERVMGHTIARRWCRLFQDSGEWEEIEWSHSPDMLPDKETDRVQIKQCMRVGDDDTLIPDWIPIPDYAGDIVDALHIIKRMRDLGYRSRYQESPLDLDTYEWIFVDSQREWTCAFRANTIPLAICGAALGMINYDNE